METVYRAYETLAYPPHPLTRAEIDLSALRENYRFLAGMLRTRDRNIRPIAVLKADAYGHGAPVCAVALAREGCERFAVASVGEGVALRHALRANGQTGSVLVLGHTDPSEVGTLAREDLTQSLFSEGDAGALAAAAERAGVVLRVHFALDTGMNRVGFAAQTDRETEATVNAVARFARAESLRAEGLFTHFAAADTDDVLTKEQTRRFFAVRDGLAARGIGPLFCHLCNSAGAVKVPEALADGARFGILLWGVMPGPTVSLPLRPVMRLRTAIVHLHRLPRGASVGYGGDYRPDGERVIATLPIGYADGLLRSASGACVTVHTRAGAQKAPVVGRVCMDQCMLDVTGTDAQVGDTVTVFGHDPADLPALADRAGTIPYELLSLLSARVPRVYTEPKGEPRYVVERHL